MKRYTFEFEDCTRTQSHVVVRHVTGDEVVAIIGIVSPGNKASNHAIKAFVGKAVELLEAGVHLLILDLFPPTPRDSQGIHHAIWSELQDSKFELPPEARLTLVSYAAGGKHKAFVEPVAAGSPLAEMPLFILPGRYIPFPLEPTYQAAFAHVP